MTNRLLYSMKEGAVMLNSSIKTVRALCDAGELKFVLMGKRTRKLTLGDIEEYIEKRKQLCPYTSRKAARTGITISNSRVYDFTALRERRAKQKRVK